MSHLVPKSNLPECKLGGVKIEKFVVSKEDASFFNLRQAMNARGRYIDPGEYTRMYVEGALAMSDTPAEIVDHSYFARIAKGYVLINGLGLGLIARAVLLKHDVEYVMINEINLEVIQLVGSYLKDEFGDKVQINEADAFLWRNPFKLRFDAVWHDIWYSICEDNYPEMKLLHRKYARWLNRNSDHYNLPFNSSWCLEEVKEVCGK